MPRLFKKVIVSFLASVVVLVSTGSFFEASAATTPTPPKPSPAAATWYNTDFSTWYGKVYDAGNANEIFGERYTAAQVQWVFYGTLAFILNQAVGVDNAPTTQCFLKNFQDLTACAGMLEKMFTSPKSSSKSYLNTQNQSLTSLIFADRPLSGVSYVRHTIQKFNLVPTANAAGPGFGFTTALEPIQPMWKGVRDISFGLFVIVAIVFSFMIMFRVKISPQVVISVQSAIPKIIMALILTTFSYAIAGFMIDLMYVVIGLVSISMAPLVSVLGKIDPPAIFNFLTLGNNNSQVGIQGVAVLDFNFGVFGLLIIYIILFVVVGLVLLVLNLGALVTVLATIGLAQGGILVILLLIILVVAILIATWVSLKTWWGLLKAFATVLLLTIFAPLQITLGTLIPNFGFGAWFKSFVAALSTFVVTGILMLLSYIFLFQGLKIGLSKYAPTFGDAILSFIFRVPAIAPHSFSGASPYWPPLLGYGTDGAGLGLLFLGASFMLFTLIPKATEVVQGFITGRPFAYGTAIGEAFGPTAFTKGAQGYATQAGTDYAASRLINRLEGSEFGTRGVGKMFTDFLKAGQKPSRGEPSPREVTKPGEKSR